MERKGIAFKIVAVGLLLTFFSRGGGGSGPAIADAPQGNDRFGLCFISAAESLASETRYDGALATGARWDRWPLYWHWVDEGGYVGSHTGGAHDYDTLVIQEIERGLTPIAILLGTPDMRATAGSTDVPPPRVQDKVFPIPGQVTIQQGEVSAAASPPVGLFEPIFADGGDIPGPGKAINQANSWADFVHNTVERYKPGGILATQQGWGSGVGVRYWEIWNEQDLNQFWSGTVAEYYRLLEVAYQTIRSSDAEATVILGALAFFEKPNWLSDLLALTNGDPAKAYFDVFSFHYYWSIYTAEYWLVRSRNTLNAHGLSGAPIWITESGVPVWDDFPATAQVPPVPANSPYRGTMEEQAAYVLQNAALAFRYGVERYYHFMLHDDCGNTPADAFGLRQNFTPHACNPAQGKPRPSYAAYQLAAEQLRDVTPLWREKKNGRDQIAFYRADDQSRVLALWATGGVTVTATVSATGASAQLYWIDSIPSGTSWGDTGVTRKLALSPAGGVYTLTLAPATNQNSGIAGDTAYYIGGRPYLLVERDTLPPTSSVEPLPPISEPGFVVRWQGEDLGSGVASYDVWVSEGGGPFRRWVTTTTATSAAFTEAYSNTYGFAVSARDRAGNEEATPTVPDTITVIGPDVYTPTSHVEPLPLTSPETFTVRWTGEDLGTGIASYDVWANDDGGPLQAWLTATTATSASFTGVISHTYGFAVRARDHAGNEEPVPATPQASTLVVRSVLASGVVLGADAKPVVGATVTISGANALNESVTGDGGLWSVTLPVGAYAFYASADGHGAWPAPRYLTVDEAASITLTLAPESNAVTAGDFEGGHVWDAWARPNGEIALTTESFDGQAAARLGSGAGQLVICAQNGQSGQLWTLRQSVDVPSVIAPTLSFLYAISTTQTTFDYAWLEVAIQAGGGVHYLVPWGELWSASDWTLMALDLSDWRGQTVTLLFQEVRCSDQSLVARLDRVSVGAAAVELAERAYLPLILR